MERQLEWPFRVTARPLRALERAIRERAVPRRAREALERAEREQAAAEQAAVELAAVERALRGRAGEERAARGRSSRPPGDLAEGVRELERFVAEVGGGRIEAPQVHGDRVVVALHARDGQRYRLEMQVTRYLAEPPACRFVDERGEPVATAWPASDGHGPFRSPMFICTPPTAEFYLHHPERRYTYGEGSLENTVATVFAALHGRGYAGRLRERRRAEAPRPR